MEFCSDQKDCGGKVRVDKVSVGILNVVDWRYVIVEDGNCEVAVEANKFGIDDSDPNSLHISINRNAKVKISVKLVDDYAFFVVNSKDTNSNCKCYLEEVLKIYTRELPAMNYAANTGKQSMFLEKCVLKGKYCTLLLKSKSTEGPGEVIAGITYQIIPADMQYAEVPLAAVSSAYQHKGFGHFLYMELRKRLQNVGVHTIYCWGDKESEGFWVKQKWIKKADLAGCPLSPTSEEHYAFLVVRL
uniref:N-acetyltransferase domain-containing protein n=1 Tax=Salix viminalis TaxID=40686 RepID=A0A6N2LTI1_SALVM